MWYPLVKNHLNPSATCLFEAFGPESAFVKQQDPHTVWTLTDTDGVDEAYSGFWSVNCLGYLISTVPVEGPDPLCGTFDGDYVEVSALTRQQEPEFDRLGIMREIDFYPYIEYEEKVETTRSTVESTLDADGQPDWRSEEIIDEETDDSETEREGYYCPECDDYVYDDDALDSPVSFDQVADAINLFAPAQYDEPTYAQHTATLLEWVHLGRMTAPKTDQEWVNKYVELFTAERDREAQTQAIRLQRFAAQLGSNVTFEQPAQIEAVTGKELHLVAEGGAA